MWSDSQYDPMYSNLAEERKGPRSRRKRATLIFPGCVQASLSLDMAAFINCWGPYEQSDSASLKPRNPLDTRWLPSLFFQPPLNHPQMLPWLWMSTFSFRHLIPPFNFSSLPVSLLSYFTLFLFDDLLSRQMRPKSSRPITQSSARWASGPQEEISGVKHYGNPKLEILVSTLGSIL